MKPARSMADNPQIYIQPISYRLIVFVLLQLCQTKTYLLYIYKFCTFVRISLILCKLTEMNSHFCENKTRISICDYMVCLCTHPYETGYYISENVHRDGI